MTSALLRRLVPGVKALETRICLGFLLPVLAAYPVHLVGSHSLPRPFLVQTNACGAGLSNLLSIAYDYNVLGLGPDYPWDD